MGKFTDEMSRLADEIQTMGDARADFIRGIQNAVKKEVEATRQFLLNFRNDMSGAREAFFGKKSFRRK